MDSSNSSTPASLKRNSPFNSNKNFAKLLKRKSHDTASFVAKVLSSQPDSFIDPNKQTTTFHHSSDSTTNFVVSSNNDILNADGYDSQLLYLSDTDSEDDGDILCLDSVSAPNETRRNEMNESERIMTILLHQARFNCSNKEIELFSRTINNMAYRSCCALSESPLINYSDWDAMIKKVTNAFLPIIEKFFYSKCGNLIGPITDLNSRSTCTENHDTCFILPKIEMKRDSASYFCSISLASWLTHLIPSVYPKLRLKRSRESKFYHDLSTATRYSELVPFISENDFILTLTVTWDGVAFTKDSSQSMWPLCAFLNELPYNERINNPLVLAIYSGNGKPKSDLMLRPLVDELVLFEKNPLTLTIDGKEFNFYIKLLLIIADAPARAVILNCSQFNSYFGK